MKLLVLGGTVFLSREVAAEAVARGHEVVCACRGESGAVPEGARLVRWDRGAGDPPPVEEIGVDVDAVVDVARQPSWVRAGVAAYPQAHWVFVSTVNVYADTDVVSERLVEPVHADGSPEQYGELKLGCEQAVTGGAASAAIVRPGLIAGPGDPSGRFSYWPERLAEGGEVLAGGSPDDVVQVIDVRDLAAWLVTLVERRTTGVLDGVGPAQPIRDLLASISPVDLTWVPSAFLAEHDVEPWSGGQALPLWLPRPEYDGMLARDAVPALDAGLVVRPVADTARDTLAWLRAHPEAPRTGLTREHERAVLEAWAAAG
jgi:2'-hydroxyisoflavone reductase